MRSVKHWSGRYLHDRLRLYLYEWTHRGDPWFAPGAIRHLSQSVTREMQCFEWGAGRSTPWFARRVGAVIAVEHDATWHKRVRRTLQQEAIQNVSLVLTGPNCGDYVRPMVDAANETFDLVIVDGISEFRDECARAAIPKLKGGGMLVIDDAHRYLPSASRAPNALHPTDQPLTEGWRAFLNGTKGWKNYRYSSGVTDTLILTRPVAAAKVV